MVYFFLFFFFKQKTAYEIGQWLEFRRVLFRSAIVNDLAFSQNVETTDEEVEQILKKVQYFDPPGIAARDLQECLMIQLKRREDDSEISEIAIKIVENCFEEFTKKHYDKIKKKLDATDEVLKKAVNTITKLNPKPGGESGGAFVQIGRASCREKV